MDEDLQNRLEKAIEKSIGMSVEELRAMSISDFRKKIEKEKGKPTKFYWNKPKLLSKEEINKMVDWALRRG